MAKARNKNIVAVGKSTRFSSENQPKKNGRPKGKTVSEWIRALGENKTIEYNIKITDSTGDTKTKKGKVSSMTSINKLIAIQLLSKAVGGDLRAVEVVLDRTEGRAQQNIDLTSKGNEITPKVDPLKVTDNSLQIIVLNGSGTDTVNTAIQGNSEP